MIYALVPVKVSGSQKRILMEPAAFAVLFTLIHAAVLLLSPREPAFQTEIFRRYADNIFAGQIPYTDFLYEYPPLSLFILLPPRFLTADPQSYALLFGAEMLLFDALILLALSRVGLLPVILYGTGMLLFLRLPFIRHDLVPVAAVALGAVLLLRGRSLWASVLWGMGGALKLYPMIAVPALAAGAGPTGALKRCLVAALIFIGGISWGLLAFGPGAAIFLVYHTDRPAMIESLYANVLLLLPGAEIVRSFGSYNVVGSFSEPLVAFSTLIQLGAAGLGFLFCWVQAAESRSSWRSLLAPLYLPEEKSAILAVRAAAAMTFAFAVFGKVLSPHFLFWPLPLLALATSLGQIRHPKTFWGIYFAAIATTMLIYDQYWAIDRDLPYFIALLTVRNALLPPIFALLLLRPRDQPDRQQPEQNHQGKTEGDERVQ